MPKEPESDTTAVTEAAPKLVERVATDVMAGCRGDARPVRLTLTGRTPGELHGLVRQVEEIATAGWFVESATRGGGRHVHGVVLLTTGELETLEGCSGFGTGEQSLRLVTGWPASPAVLSTSLERIVAYDVRVLAHARERGDENPVRAWGTGGLNAAGLAAHAFIEWRADSTGRVCACGCGEPLPPGKRRYVSDSHAARDRKRRERDRKRKRVERVSEPEPEPVPTLEDLERLATEAGQALSRLYAGLVALRKHGEYNGGSND